MTIHEESMRQLCVGADYQQGIADKAQDRAEDLARRVGPAEERLNTLRKQAEAAKQDLDAMRARLAEEQQLAMNHGRLAADFLALATRECEANGWDMPAPAAPERPRSAEQIRQAVDDLTQPPHGVSLKCFNGLCKTDLQACEGCEHDCHWISASEAEKPPAAGNTQPDPAPEAKAEARVRSPWALLLALYVRLVLLGGRQGGHAGRWRVFKHRSIVEVV